MKKYILIGLLAIISTITSVQAQEERNHGIIWSALHGLEYEIKAGFNVGGALHFHYQPKYAHSQDIVQRYALP